MSISQLFSNGCAPILVRISSIRSKKSRVYITATLGGPWTTTVSVNAKATMLEGRTHADLQGVFALVYPEGWWNSRTGKPVSGLQNGAPSDDYYNPPQVLAGRIVFDQEAIEVYAEAWEKINNI